MIVAHRMEVSDDVRRGVRQHLGKSGLATRAEIKRELGRLWSAFVEKRTAPTPLSAPALPKPEQRTLDLAMYTTATLAQEVAKRLGGG